jgi:hypothetical protein
VITKEQLLDSMRMESHIIKHLAEKIPAHKMDWRPTPGQRSIRELLQYLTLAAILPAKNLITNDWEHAEAMNAAAEKVTPETFAAAMDAQMEQLEELLADVDVASALETDRQMPWGAPVKQGAGFVDMVLKCLVAYRMQLFLYAKESGLTELSSANCWVGVDWKPPEDSDADASV